MRARKNNDTTNREDGYPIRLAKRAFERVKPSLGEIPADRVEKPRLDLHAVAIFLRRVSNVVERPEVRERLEALPREMFDPRRLDQLRELSLAAWYARAHANDILAESSEVRVAPELIEQARAVKHRMLRVLDYYFAENAPITARLDSIRAGLGHQTLASDLSRLADLYEDHRAEIEDDATWYREEDGRIAQSLAGRIVDQLAAREPVDWKDLLARLWTRVREVYDDVRQAAAFAFRGEALALEFPSIHTATRARPHAVTEEEAEPGEEPGAGGEEVPTAAPTAPAPEPPTEPPAAPRRP